MKMNEAALNRMVDSVKKMGRVVSFGGGIGKGIPVEYGNVELGSPGDDKFRPSTKDVVKDGGKLFVAAVKNQLQPLFAAAGLGETDYAPAVAAAEKAFGEAKTEFEKALPSMSVSFPHKDGEVEQFAKEYILKKYPGGKILKVGTVEADWTIWKNNIGIPESRTRVAGVVFKDPTLELCLYAGINVGQDYAGGGKFSKNNYFSGMGGAIFGAYAGKCK
jgi:hypothetical protein